MFAAQSVKEVVKMFKKSMFFAAVLILGANLATADLRSTPVGPASALPSSDYGGVDISTIAVSSANALIDTGEGSIVGFVASSTSLNTDFIIFRATNSLLPGTTSAGTALTDDFSTNNELVRVYMTTTSFTINGNGIQQGTTYKFPMPLHYKRGICAKMSSAAYNMVTIFYTKLNR
jgi:hypothetical protein